MKKVFLIGIMILIKPNVLHFCILGLAETLIDLQVKNSVIGNAANSEIKMFVTWKRKLVLALADFKNGNTVLQL